MSERPRGKEQRIEILTGYTCNMTGCNWKIGPKPLFEALRDFGKHNLEAHTGTMQAHIQPISEWVPIQRNPSLGQS